FKNIASDFQQKDETQIQLSISLLYLGLGMSQLFYGALSDSIGRKPTIYIGLLLFIIGCIISYLSNDLNTLLIGQIIQGIGLGAPRVMSVAIVRDRFEGSEMARAMSFIMVIYILTSTVSSILGKTLIVALNWKILFIIYSFFGIIIFLLFKYRMPETLKQEKQKNFTLRDMIKAIAELFNNKKSISYILILGLYSGVFIGYLNLSQFIFEFQYHLEERYPFYFAFLALSIGFASFINGKLVRKIGMERLIKIAIVSSVLIVPPYLIVNYFDTASLWVFLAFMFVQLFGYGILIGNLSALAMQAFGHVAGLGASIVGAISTLVSVPLAIFIGHFYTNSSLPIVIGFLAVGTISLLLINFINRIAKYEN
ncbi:MAG: multidrug effflux MFS transporter, partial [Flavobacteriales bacterium]|nr:multidrug effflux MFS transporter [Flavobacteriales bacterium]